MLYKKRGNPNKFELARESMNTNWIKVELIGEDEMLLPDPIELYSTCEELIKKKF